MLRLRFIALSILAALTGCLETTSPRPSAEGGCPGAVYPEPAASSYRVPFAVGTAFNTGLANCSASFHGAGQPDQFATDFDLPSGTPFIAARSGVVSFVQENQPSLGGNNNPVRVSGNAVFVDHGDGTSALYLHSPMDGILVDVGDTVQAGDTLGLVGASGLAGYPHLHFIVVQGSDSYPYDGVPVTFRNADPADAPLQTYSSYLVTPPS